MLEVTGLRFETSNRALIEDVSFSAARGDIIGFIGLNGAGKTTCMRMIAGVLEPTNGNILIDGIDIWKERKSVQRSLGFLPEGAPLYGEMSPKSYLQFICEARDIDKDKRREYIIDAAEKTNIQKVFHQRIDTLSKGFRRRVAMAGTIVHRPKILLLDEPTDGLDPQQKRTTYDLIRTISPECIIIISTHMLEELENICNRAIIINDGKIIKDFTPKDLALLGDDGKIENGFHNITQAPILENVQ